MTGTILGWGRFKLSVLGLLLLGSSLAQAQQLSGAIFTTLPDGTAVNHNIYDDAKTVYLNGGPQNHNGSLLPAGIYYFQVTIPSGHLLLSNDPATDRLVLVDDSGRIVGRCQEDGTLLPGVPGPYPPDPGALTPYPHPDGPTNVANGNTPVQLWPFDETTNQGGEYKAWLIERALKDKQGHYVFSHTTIEEDGIHLDYKLSETKTDNFKIKVPGGGDTFIWEISGNKFYDKDYDGFDSIPETDNGELPVQNFPIHADVTYPPNYNPGPPPAGVTVDGTGNWISGSFDLTTDASGSYNFSAPDQATYSIYENPEPGSRWLETAPALGGQGDEAYSGTVNGGNITGLDFGNIQQGRIAGIKFYDKNMNGIQDAGEPGVKGVNIHVAITYPDGTPGGEDDTTLGDGSWQSGYYPDGSTFVVTETGLGSQWYGTTGPQTGKIGPGTQAPLKDPGATNDDLSIMPYDVTYHIDDKGDVDFGNILMGSIVGHKFNDTNMNGKLDSGEAGIKDVVIHCTGTKPNGDPINDTTTSAADGSYSFGPYPDGSTYSITEDVPAGYQQTTPSPVTGTITSSGSIDVNSTIDDTTVDIGNIAVFNIRGVKFYDSNMNGAQDAGEATIPGVTIKITGTKPNGDSISDSKTTDASGAFSFGPYPDGTTFSISETSLGSNWIETTTDPINGKITGSDSTGNNVGNILTGKIAGTKFVDANMDGTQNNGEVGMPGVTINITGLKPNGDPISDSTVSGANGTWSFGPYPDGSTFSITETVPPGYLQTTATPATGTISSSGTITVTSTIPDKPVGVGNIAVFCVKGLKFYDKNMNGVKDAGDPTVAGITINIIGKKPNGSTFTDSTTTDANGAFKFGPYPNGTTFSLTETLPTGWIRTTTSPVTGTLNGADSTGNNFGNILTGSLCGDKFYDSNANGAYDSGEPFIKGFKIQVSWKKPNGTTGTDTFYTDASGKFTAGPYPDGTTFTVTETAPNSNWHQSFPASKTYTGAITSSGVITGMTTIPTQTGFRFGNFLTGGGNGLTPGYWSNNNGYNSANAIGWTTVFGMLNTSNLRNLNGTIQTWPVTANGYKSYQTWTGAGTNASNMATQLSVHLGAFELNVMSGKIPGSTLIYAPGSTSANALGYATANALIAEAVKELGLHGLTVQSGATRTYQENLKNAFANANMAVSGSTVLPPVTVIVPSPY